MTASGETVECGKARRSEAHDRHRWTFQPEDDDPYEVEVWCSGHPGGSTS